MYFLNSHLENEWRGPQGGEEVGCDLFSFLGHISECSELEHQARNDRFIAASHNSD